MPYYGYYGFDWTYLYLVLPCIILSMWASSNVNSTFKKYSRQFSRRGLPVQKLPRGFFPQTVFPASALSGLAAI
jgi:Zn-dependent membrane protease YugP